MYHVLLPYWKPPPKLYSITAQKTTIQILLISNNAAPCWFQHCQYFYVLLNMHPHTISQIIQLGAQFCLNIYIYIFIYLFLFSTCFGHPSAHHQEKITVSMRYWYLSLWMSGVWSTGWIQPADQMPPIRSDKYQCHIDTVIFSWWWALGCPKHVEKRNK